MRIPRVELWLWAQPPSDYAARLRSGDRIRELEFSTRDPRTTGPVREEALQAACTCARAPAPVQLSHAVTSTVRQGTRTAPTCFFAAGGGGPAVRADTLGAVVTLGHPGVVLVEHAVLLAPPAARLPLQVSRDARWPEMGSAKWAQKVRVAEEPLRKRLLSACGAVSEPSAGLSEVVVDVPVLQYPLGGPFTLHIW